MLQGFTGQCMEAKQCSAATDITAPTDGVRNYATTFFTPGIPLYNAVYHLMQRIYQDFNLRLVLQLFLHHSTL